MNMIKAKRIGIMRLTILLGMILFGFYLFNDQASSRTMVPEPPVLLTNAFVTDRTSSVVPAIPAPILPSQFIILPLSARQACIQTPGWQWREGGGFAMCFKSGHARCPIGHPWMTRMTQNYTICVSIENPAWMSPNMYVQ